MRRKDWADYESERLFDLVRECIHDDETIIEEIGKSLRKSAKTHHEEPVTGPIGERPKEDDDD